MPRAKNPELNQAMDLLQLPYETRAAICDIEEEQGTVAAAELLDAAVTIHIINIAKMSGRMAQA